jgi:hypothetical protein
MSNQSTVSSYRYNGLGDRLTQNGVNYKLDLNTGLTRVLSDGTNTYLCGPSTSSGWSVGRIAQVNTTALVTDYFIADALSSVRQLTDAGGAITYASAHDPYNSAREASPKGATG